MEAKIPAVFKQNTPKVILIAFKFFKTYIWTVRKRVQLQNKPRTSTDTESQTEEDVWKSRAVKKRKGDILEKNKKLEEENKNLKERVKKLEEENRNLEGEAVEDVNESENFIIKSDNEKTVLSHLSISPKNI